MELADGLIIAVAGAFVSGLAAILGAVIGARSTRRATAEALQEAARQETAAREEARRQVAAGWRMALHYECLNNIELTKEPPDGFWSFDFTVMRQCSADPGAFTPEVLQRMIWARAANERADALIARLGRVDPPWLPDCRLSWKRSGSGLSERSWPSKLP